MIDYISPFFFYHVYLDCILVWLMQWIYAVSIEACHKKPMDIRIGCSNIFVKVVS